MKAQHLLIGSVVMALFIIHNATGQTPAANLRGVSDRKEACELLEAALRKADQEKGAAKQLALDHSTADQVLKLCPHNLVVSQVLKEALAKGTASKNNLQSAKLLREALRQAQETLAFKPLIEAPLPEGFPEPTPVGEIQIKQYPDYRMARTQMAGAETGAFFTLFNHIKKKDIAMTAPVEMTYSVNSKDKLQGQSMAFLYRSTKQGASGKNEQVEVIDIPAMTALSLGIRGDLTQARLEEAKGHLDAWLRRHSKEYEASGSIRVMGYNSPFVAANKRFTEVEIPVRQITPSH